MKVRLVLHDELPKLGSGARIVNAKVGRKWVRLTDCMGRRVKLTVGQYASLKPQELAGELLMVPVELREPLAA